MGYFTFLMTLICLIAFLAFAGGPSQKEVRFIEDVAGELLRFCQYCEKHKEDLPPHIRERFEEMEANLKHIEIARGDDQ